MLKQQDREDEAKVLDELHTELAGPLARAIAEALRRPREQIPVREIQDALTSGAISAVPESVDRDRLKEVLLAVWLAFALLAMRRAWEDQARRLRIPLAFDPSYPQVQAFVSQQLPVLAQAIADESKQALATVLQQALVEGHPPSRIAQRIREMVGLTERQALAVERRWALLNQDPTMAARRVDELVDDYARTLLRDRAETIARTELLRAAAAGANQMWLTARDQGLLPPTAKREWVARMELGGVCPGCVALDGTTVGLDEPWSSNLFGVLMHPPAHVHCRCWVRIRL